ncbi:hypothetical protein BASA81_004037 [Batrachochytrium salamandrivorans]|nr:hypothetical protein BASA81_004037 [Batrachochytrium salamandrivorans]
MTVVSIIIPAHNAASTILETLEALEAQEFTSPHQVLLELSIHDDGSTDNTLTLCREFVQSRWTRGRWVISTSPLANGPGFARNQCIQQSTGQFLCFNDADDVSKQNRIQSQLDLWRTFGTHEVLIGSRFSRIPVDATRHYADFINSLSSEQLLLKQYRELTVIQPTWFMSKEMFNRVPGGGYAPVLGEDLILFHQLLDIPNFQLAVCEEPLVVYRHLSGSVSSNTPRKELVRVRVQAFVKRVLVHWPSFQVWGAGRDGRAFFEFLPIEHRCKISQFVDVAPGKIASGFHHSGMILPVRHFTQVRAPFVVCVAMGRTNGELESNIASLGLVEGIDYWHFT